MTGGSSRAPIALKDDEGKLRMDLVPVGAIRSLARVFEYGAKKYGEWNWRKFTKDDWKRLYAAAMRHLTVWWEGEDFDSESHLHHLEHVLAEVAMLVCLVIWAYSEEGE